MRLNFKSFSTAMLFGALVVTNASATMTTTQTAPKKGEAFVSQISGTVNAWEEGEHYIVQVTSDELENVKLKLDGRTVKVATGSDIAIGDVIAENEKGELLRDAAQVKSNDNVKIRLAKGRIEAKVILSKR